MTTDTSSHHIILKGSMINDAPLYRYRLEETDLYPGCCPFGLWPCICIKYLLLNVVPSPTFAALGNVLVDPLDLAESESEI